jgi:hypothetical protein
VPLLSWFGHVQRRPDTRTVKKIFKWKPLTKRSQGRPKNRWKDNIKQDICQMKIKNWVACVQDRRKWKDVVEKAKTFNSHKESSAPRRRRRRRRRRKRRKRRRRKREVPIVAPNLTGSSTRPPFCYNSLQKITRHCLRMA